MRKLIVAALAGVLLLVVAGDPSMGTQVDLDPTNQVAGQIVGENHAKPLPRPGAHLAELLHSLVRAATWFLAALVLVPMGASWWTRPQRPTRRPWGGGTSRTGDLRARSDGTPRPARGEDGLLWCDHRWVVIPDQQLAIAHLLIEHANQLVRTSTVTAAYMRSGGSGHRASIKTMLNRLAGRFEEVGLVLRFVRGKGVLLEVPGTF